MYPGSGKCTLVKKALQHGVHRKVRNLAGSLLCEVAFWVLWKPVHSSIPAQLRCCRWGRISAKCKTCLDYHYTSVHPIQLLAAHVFLLLSPQYKKGFRALCTANGPPAKLMVGQQLPNAHHFRAFRHTQPQKQVGNAVIQREEERKCRVASMASKGP